MPHCPEFVPDSGQPERVSTLASITKIASGWRARVRKGGVSESECFKTKAEATAWANKIESDIVAGKVGRVPDKSFGELLDKYAKDVSAHKRGARWEEIRINKLKQDKLADVRLPKLTAPVVTDWRDRRIKEVSAASVRREWNLLSHACALAVREWHWLQTNPFTLVKRPDEAKPRDRRPTKEELDAILLALGYSTDDTPDTMTARVGAAALFAIETGMRASEICRLTRADLDGRVAHLSDTKNGHDRDVPMSVEALRIISQLPDMGGPLFGLTTASLDALWRKGCARAMVTDLHFHDLRREALTRLAAKVDVLTLAKISGHRDLRILSAVYYRPSMQEVADKIG